MVDLPVYQPKDYTTEAPTPKISGFDIARSSSYVADGMQKLSSGLEDLATPLAEQQGKDDAAKAVTRNADGSISVDNPQTSVILGKAGTAYTHAVQAGTLSALQTQMGADMTNIRQQHMDDPAGFQKAAGSYIDGLASKYSPGVADGLQQYGNQLATQHFDGLVNSKAQRDVDFSKQSISTNYDDAKNQLQVLARTGGTDTPEFKQQLDKANSLLDQLGTNRLFGFSADKIASEKKNLIDSMQGEAVVGTVDRTFNKKGVGEALRVLNDQIYNNPNSSLSDLQRTRLVTMGKARLDALTSGQKAAIDANKDNVTQFISATQKGGVPQEAYEAARDHAIAIGDTEGHQKIDAYWQIMNARKNGVASPNLTPEQQFNSVMSGGARGSAMPVGGFDAAMDRTFKEEGGLLAHDTNGTPSKFGINQAAHPEVNMDSLTQDQAKAIYKRDYWNAIGGDSLPPQLAHVAFDTAVVAGPGKAKEMLAQAGGDPQKFMELREQFQNRLLQQDPDKYGRFAKAWDTRNSDLRADIGAAPGARMVSAGGAMPFSREQAAQNPFLVSAYLHSLASDPDNRETLGSQIGSGILNSLKAGIAPNSDTLANYFQLASTNPTKFGEQRDQIMAQMGANGTASQVGNLPPAVGQQVVDQAMKGAQGSSILQAQYAQALKDSVSRDASNLKNDPFGEAAKRGWIGKTPDPLNFQDPNALANGFAQRAVAATQIGSHQGDASQSMISPQELNSVSAVMTNGTMDQKLAVLSSVTQAGVSEPVMKATLADLAKKPETQALAAAGYVARDNPEAAKSILAGDQILHSEGGFKFGPGNKEAATAAQQLPAAAFPNLEARDGMMRAAKAYYAKLSYDAGDASEKINPDRYKQAVNAVTGGILNYRGGTIIAPWYGASNNDLHAALQAVPDQAFNDVTLADGVPFTKSMIVPGPGGATAGNRSFSLQSVGAGKYWAYTGPDNARQYVRAPMTLDGDGGGNFTLNLGKYKGQLPAQGSGVSLSPPGQVPMDMSYKGRGGDASTGGDFSAFGPAGKQVTLPVSPEMGQTGMTDSFKP